MTVADQTDQAGDRFQVFHKDVAILSNSKWTKSQVFELLLLRRKETSDVMMCLANRRWCGEGCVCLVRQQRKAKAKASFNRSSRSLNRRC